MSAQHKHLCLAGVCLAVDYQSLKYEQPGLHTWVHLLTSMWSNICYHICEMNLKSLLFLCDAHSFGIALSVCSAWRASRGKNLCGFHKHPVYYNLLKATRKKIFWKWLYLQVTLHVKCSTAVCQDWKKWIEQSELTFLMSFAAYYTLQHLQTVKLQCYARGPQVPPFDTVL